MKARPTPNEMYRAVIERDTNYDGVFFIGVRTTGIFCRPGCGAKKPKRENVEFFDRASDAMHAGYRACQRCRPLDGGTKPPEWVGRVVQLAEHHGERRLTAMDLRRIGVGPERARRYFKKHYGMTFQAYHRARRLGKALGAIREGTRVAQASIRAGYASEGAFRKAFEEVFGAVPTKVDEGAGTTFVRWMETPLGALLVGASDAGVRFVEFVDRRALEAQVSALRRRTRSVVVPGDHAHLRALEREMRSYFKGELKEFAVPIDAPGTPFQERVWAALKRIPHGQTRSYAQIAHEIGEAKAVRAVAKANGDNRIAILIPCHRVIGSDGTLTGYGGGLWRKEWLLDLERGESQPELFVRTKPEHARMSSTRAS